MLIGVSDYEDPDFPSIAAARNSLGAMYTLLTDPALCGWPEDRVKRIPNPTSSTELATQLVDIAERTTGVLLVYYVGHGVLTPRGKLCLTVTSSIEKRSEFTSLPWETVSDILTSHCPARVRLAILDCCFAGQAIEALGSESEAMVANAAHAEGVYTLTATTRNRTAHVVPPQWQHDACTSFTGELRDLVHEGIQDRPAQLTLGEIYPVLRKRLQDKELPLPNQRGIDTADRYPFTANAAYSTRRVSTATPASVADVAAAPPQPHEPTAAVKLTVREFDAAVQTAYAIPDDRARSRALAAMAQQMRAVDPDLATALLDDAEICALAVKGAAALAQALAELGAAVLADDAEHAARLFDSAEATIEKIWSKYLRAEALAQIAPIVAADRARTERVIQAIRHPGLKATAQADVALALAATDPRRAELTAMAIADDSSRAHAMARIAPIVARTDLHRALEIARMITDVSARDSALAGIVQKVAQREADRAERIARAITNKTLKSEALAKVVSALAVVDPDRAQDIVGEITDKYWKEVAQVQLARNLASSDSSRASRAAHKISNKRVRTELLAKIAAQSI